MRVDFFSNKREKSMTIKTIKSKKSQKISKLIYEELGIGYNQIQKIIRNKDVKIDGKRVSKDYDVNQGSVIEVYFSEKKIEIEFENQDIVVVLKPKNIETVSEGEDLKTKLEKQLNIELFAVHRLDRNTQGLVVFAKNLKAKKSLDDAIKNRKIKKFYLAKVFGVPEKNEDKLVAYLKKDDKKSCVDICDLRLNGYEEIKTNYKVIKQLDNFSILEIELVTGKTHQIRAHLSHIGLPILGDEKYGNDEVNRLYKKKYQCLCAYKLIFQFEKKDYLGYLNDVVIELNREKVEFLKNDK